MQEHDSVSIKDFDYALPLEQIAQFPLASRDSSRLLVCRQGAVSEDVFSNIGQHLPSNSLLVFNNTRVIRARLIFAKPTGSKIEIFCLEPLKPTTEIQAACHQQEKSSWKCLVGNLKRWKSGPLALEFVHQEAAHHLFANMVDDCGDGSFEIEFHWDPPEKTFSEILELAGRVPLPPYINRSANDSDNERYQTVYAAHEGSVAAPTAGLHFTAPLLDKLQADNLEFEHVTLHVGVGTFRPVTANTIRDHVMHHEKIVVPGNTIARMLKHLDRPIFAVGTTSARTIESLYWLGVQLITQGSGSHPVVSQWSPYRQDPDPQIPARQSLEALLSYLDEHHLEEYSGETQLMIIPGYEYRLLSGLITNFHMPQSTLLLLVAAMVGDDWKKAYDYALQNGFRFLSYGDSCLFFNERI